MLAVAGYEDATEKISCFGPKPQGGADMGLGPMGRAGGAPGGAAQDR